MTTLIIAACALARTSSPFQAIPAPVSFATLLATDIPLKAPDGWKSTKQEGAVVLTPGDLPEGSVFTVVVTPLQTKAGTLDEVYDIGKKELDGIGTYTSVSAPVQLQSGGGWDYKFTIGTLEKDGKGLIAQVTGVKKGDAGGVIILFSDSIETMQKYSQPFGEALRSIGGALKPPPLTDFAPASGNVDLQYTVPSGWIETKKAGATVIESTHEDFYDKWRWTMVILPSQPLTGSLHDAFADYWKALVADHYESNVVPLPLTARLGDGYACAFDGDQRATHRTNGAKPRIVAVYLIAHGDRFVPVLAILYGYMNQLDKDLNQFIETARIPGSSSNAIPLFSKAEVAGDWSQGSAEIATYVNSSGGYAGDASVYAGAYFHLRTDGTYDHVLIGISSSRRVREADQGKWSIDDNELVLKRASGVARYTLLGCGVDAKAGRFLVLGSNPNQKAKISFANPRGVLQADWYKIK